MDSQSISQKERIWIDSNGDEHLIYKMSDLHLFSVMESLIKLTRMKRRKELEYLTVMIEMYDDSIEIHLSQDSYNIKDVTLKVFDSINEMNTDAYGTEYIKHYKEIMLEAAARNMRDLYEPIYDKTNAL